VAAWASAGHLLRAGLARLKELLLFTLGALQAGETLALLFKSRRSHSLFVAVITPGVMCHTTFLLRHCGQVSQSVLSLASFSSQVKCLHISGAPI
jgi:hypothetical protein